MIDTRNNSSQRSKRSFNVIDASSSNNIVNLRMTPGTLNVNSYNNKNTNYRRPAMAPVVLESDEKSPIYRNRRQSMQSL